MAKAEIALIVGAGPGLGAALARCFARAGMRVAMAARDGDRLQPLARDLADLGGQGRAYDCDAAVESDVETLFGRVKADLGEPNLVVYNAGAFVRRGILETERDEFERCWRIGCLGGFLVGRAAARVMTARAGDGGAGGSILFTGATASLRGGAGFANLAVGKFGLRALAQSMARELGPKGVHVGHVIIDGIIASERSGGRKPDHSLLDPDAVAETYLAIHRQPKSVWTLELDVRPWAEKF